MPSFDIVIVTCPKDFKVLPYCLRSIQNYVAGFSKMYIVTRLADMDDTQRALCQSHGVHLIDESKFECIDKAGIAHMNCVREDRTGWYYQQLLKLYAFKYIPELSEYYLVIDSDVVFFKPFAAFDDEGQPNYAYGDENNQHYFTHMARLLPELRRAKDMSGICHHMMFHVPKLLNLFSRIEHHHNGKPFWRVFLECVDRNVLSGASEYEIYFNFMCLYYADEMEIRSLRWRNWVNDYDSQLCRNNELDFIGLHAYRFPSNLNFLN